MTLPFTSLVAEQRELGLVVAVVLGFLFGFVLERAGFGRSTKLAAQFYFRDMTVFKVMFGAIVTAMLGLVIASSFGIVELRAVSETIASWTYIWPMLAGGLVLGVGFIVSGYCPGTSIVGAASGNIDGFFAFGGVVVGTFVYSELLRIPAFANFHSSGDKGALFLYDILPVPAAALAVAIALVAMAAFVGAEKVERLIAAREDRVFRLTPSTRRRVFATIGALASVAFVMMFVPLGEGRAMQQAPPVISASELARLLIDEPWNLRVVDLRSDTEFGKGSIPGSENARPDALADLGLQYTPATKHVVVVSANGSTGLPSELRRPNVRMLHGGFDAWKRFAIDPPAPPAATASGSELQAYAFQSSVHQALTGLKTAPAVSAAPKGVVVKPKKKGGGCSA